MAGTLDSESEKALFGSHSPSEYTQCYNSSKINNPACKASASNQKISSRRVLFEDLVEQGKRALMQCNVHHIFNKIQEQMAQLHGAGYRCLLLWHRPSEDGRKKQTSGWRAFSPSIVEMMTVKEKGHIELSAYGKMVLETFIAMHMEIIAKENGNILIDEEDELIEEKDVDLSWYNLDQSQPSPPNSDSDTPTLIHKNAVLMASKNVYNKQSESYNKFSNVSKTTESQPSDNKTLFTSLDGIKTFSPKNIHSPSHNVFSSLRMNSFTSTTNFNHNKSLLPDVASSRITPSPSSSSSSSHISCQSFSLPKASCTNLNSSSAECTNKSIDHSNYKMDSNPSSSVKSSNLSSSTSVESYKNVQNLSKRQIPQHRFRPLSKMSPDEAVYKLMSPKVILFKLSKDKLSKVAPTIPKIKRPVGRPRKNPIVVKNNPKIIQSVEADKRHILSEDQPVLTKGGVHYQLTIAQTTDDWDRIDCPCGKPYHGRPMTICLICKRWWHDECAGLKWKKKENPHWICPNCSENSLSNENSLGNDSLSIQNANECIKDEET